MKSPNRNPFYLFFCFLYLWSVCLSLLSQSNLNNTLPCSFPPISPYSVFPLFVPLSQNHSPFFRVNELLLHCLSFPTALPAVLLLHFTLPLIWVHPSLTSSSSGDGFVNGFLFFLFRLIAFLPPSSFSVSFGTSLSLIAKYKVSLQSPAGCESLRRHCEEFHKIRRIEFFLEQIVRSAKFSELVDCSHQLEIKALVKRVHKFDDTACRITLLSRVLSFNFVLSSLPLTSNSFRFLQWL